MQYTFKCLIVVGIGLIVSGCSIAPKYERASVTAPPAFKEAQTKTQDSTTSSEWKVAQPSEVLPRGQWWRVFGDEQLDKLETQALAANQDLAAAAARVKEARSINDAARSNLFPSIGAGFGPTRERVSASSIFEPDGSAVPQQTFWRAQASASYEVDLFGRVSSTIAESHAKLQQSEALFRSVELALQADVAQNYFALRELDTEAAIYASTIDLREQALIFVQHRFAEGDISDLDVSRAVTELATARSDAMTAARLRAASEHSLAVLLGKAPAELVMTPAPLQPVELDIPPGLPSSLLERRPDITAAERAMAAANARVGIAKAAFFPSLSLTGTGGFESATIADLFQWSSRAFLLGPLVGTALNIPIFDGGRRKGDLAKARAVYEEDVARYRQQVLVAFREVEDNLADLRILKDQTAVQADGMRAALRAAQVVKLQYAEGAVDYLSVIDAERSALTSRRSEAQLRGLQAAATVNLIRALGGGWDANAAAPIGATHSKT
ncbi:efflux transporter outer membrane subunit [Paraburkholderia nemoris]|uniref:efflux transporter outer membrane subunit n=1 Tax=Paraburkholderia nemoris TaxID=2793076 RepID=UPI0038BC0665